MERKYFKYGETEIAHLKRRDKRLAAAIEKLGMPKRRVEPDLFRALVFSIIGQQISTKAHDSIWRKMTDALGEITPQSVLATQPEDLRALGISFRKIEYMRGAAEKIASGEFDIDALRKMTDDKVCEKLSEIKGVGKWTAEMLMLHSLRRPDVLSFGDFGIQRGLRMVYGHGKITRGLFEKYRKKYSPYGSVACIYLWAVASGAIDGLKDPAEKPKPQPPRGKEPSAKKNTAGK